MSGGKRKRGADTPAASRHCGVGGELTITMADWHLFAAHGGVDAGDAVEHLHLLMLSTE